MGRVFEADTVAELSEISLGSESWYGFHPSRSQVMKKEVPVRIEKLKAMFKQTDSSGNLRVVNVFACRMPINDVGTPKTHASQMLLLFSVGAEKPEPILSALASTHMVEEPPLRSYPSSTSRIWGFLSG